MTDNVKIKIKTFRSTSGPNVKIYLNKELKLDLTNIEKEVETYSFSANFKDNNLLEITHYGKLGSDTVVENGKIVSDKAVEIMGITINNFEIPKNILYTKFFYPVWAEGFDLSIPKRINNNVFLGFNGTYVFDFTCIEKNYYEYFWQMEADANLKFQEVDLHQEAWFTAYGQKFKIDDDFNLSLTELKKIIEQNETVKQK